MTKATYKKLVSLGSWFQRVRVYDGEVNAWWQEARATAESLQLDPHTGGRKKEHTRNVSLWKLQSPPQ